MPTYSNWTSTTTPISYVPKEKPVYETVGLFTSSTQGIVPPTQNESTNTGQYILAQDGTWIPQPSFSSGGSNAYEILRPAVLGTTYSAYPPTVTNTSYAYDADTNHATTFAEFECASQTRINTITDTLTYSTFASRAQTWTAATINVSRAYGYFDDGESNATTGASNRNTSVTIEYSINNGTNWFTLATDISTSIPSTATSSSAALSTTTPTMANILVKLTLVRGGGGQIYDPDTSANLPGSTGDIDLKIYDIWISGTYTSGAGNITCNDLLVTGDATLQNKLYDGSGSAGTAGYILSSTGTKTAWVPDSVGSGTVTSITTTGANGVTISGGSTQTITTSGTFALALGAITPTSIATGTGSFTGDVEFASSIKSPNASNSPVTIAPDGTGDVHLNADSVRIGDNNADATIATRGTGDLIITTNEGSAVEGIVRLYDGANGNITLTPNGSGQVKVGTDQVVTLAASQTLTNKTISGSSNTLSNIANASLTNSTISGVALGSNLNALTISSPLSGGSYNGSSAVSIGIPVATTSVNGYLSSADWTTFNNKGSGSVTSVAATVPSLLSISGSPITTSGTLAITYSGTALPVANGGTGLTTLTAGYIPYGAGTSAFGSSANLFWDSANSRLGIGTAAPATKLDISGTLRFTPNTGDTNYSADIKGNYNSTHPFQIDVKNNGSSAEYIGVYADSGGSNNRVVFPTGNVGIGTSTPYNLLEANKSGGATISIANSASGAGIMYGKLSFYSTDAAGAYSEYGGQIRSYSGIGIDHSDLRFYTGNGATTAERVRITSAGLLGIGTASPSQKLTLGGQTGSSATPLALQFSDDWSDGYVASKSKIYLYNNGGSGVWGFAVGPDNDIQYHSGGATNTNGQHKWYSGNVEFMRLNASGNLGIGTASPSNKLDVVGVIRATNGSIIANTGATVNAQFILSDNGTNKWQTYYDASAGSYNIYSTTASSVRLSIDSSGNVGIGTASPASKLNVSGGNVTVSAGYGIAWSGDQARIMTPEDNVSGALIAWGSGGICRFLNGSTESMRLNSTGLGIGTASPLARLSIYTGSAGTLMTIQGSGTRSGFASGVVGGANTFELQTLDATASTLATRYLIRGATDTANHEWYSGARGSESCKMFLEASTGNVGIGNSTSSPSEKLHVIGNIRASGVYVGNGSTGSYTKGFGGILTTTSTSTPTGGSSGDFALIY